MQRSLKIRQIWLAGVVALALLLGHLGSGWAARHAVSGAPAVHIAAEPGQGGGGFGGFGGGGFGGGGAGGSW